MHNFFVLAPSLKTDVQNDLSWCEIESGFGKPGGGHIPTKISQEYPPPRVI